LTEFHGKKKLRAVVWMRIVSAFHEILLQWTKFVVHFLGWM